jgi:neutral ceramidase
VPLTAGTGRATITPPLGIALSGFVGRGGATDVHDDLFATALVLADAARPDDRWALVTLDLIGLYGDDLVRMLKDAVRNATGIPPARVWLSCSHTHYGPVVAEHGDMPGGATPLAAVYRATLAAAVAASVREADAARIAVTVAAGRSSARVGVNRRRPVPGGGIALAPHPGGHVDDEVLVLRFDAATTDSAEPTVGTALATLVSYACHPSSLESTVRSVSADFPGALRAEFERKRGGRALFLQGAAGDIDPIDKRPDWALPAQYGALLAGAAVEAAEHAVPVATSPLTSARARVALPRRGAASVFEAEAELRALAEAQARAREDDPAHWWRGLKIDEAEVVVGALRDGRSPTIDADISALRIGDVALVFAPAELFSELGARIKRRSPSGSTIVVGYTDGALWYVPTRAAFDEGGYEVVDACRVAPGAGERLADSMIGLLRDLFPESAPRAR